VIPFSDAVTVTFWALGTVAVVAEKVAVLWFVATVTLAGIVNAALLLFKEMAELLRAALFSVTIQVLDALLPRVEGEQDIDESCAGALAARVKV
jgi:hypothetical protein